MTRDDFTDIVANEVISYHLGEAWLRNNTADTGSRHIQTGYLQAGSTPMQKLISLHRRRELARRLYALQSFSWFPHIVTNLSSRDLLAASFEVDVCWALQICALNIEVRKEVGRKTEDFDLSAVLAGRPTPIEVKTKREDTPFTKETIVNTLKGAIKQLPKGEQGILFMRLPFAWVGGQLEAEYDDALYEGSRQTSRIAAIITAIDKPHINAPGTGRIDRHYTPFKHDLCPPDLWKSCLRFIDFWNSKSFGMAPVAPF